MTENEKAEKAREKWRQTYLFRRVGMKESYLILRNAWFLKGGMLEDENIWLEFLSDDFLE